MQVTGLQLYERIELNNTDLLSSSTENQLRRLGIFSLYLFCTGWADRRGQLSELLFTVNSYVGQTYVKLVTTPALMPHPTSISI